MLATQSSENYYQPEINFMGDTSISNVYRELFQSPLKAVTEAEADYRRIWSQWLQDQLALVTEQVAPDPTKPDQKVTKFRDGVDFSKILNAAPVISLDGVIEVGITMRISSARELDANVNVGLSIGPIYASGGFGFKETTSQESVFQASTRFTLSNQSKDLTKYLADRNIPVTKPDEVQNAIKLLTGQK